MLYIYIYIYITVIIRVYIFARCPPTLQCLLLIRASREFASLTRPAITMKQPVPTSTYKYLQAPTSTYKYLQVPTSTYKYLQVPTSTYKYLQVPTSTYKLQDMSTGFQQDWGNMRKFGRAWSSATKGAKPFSTNLTAKDFRRHKLQGKYSSLSGRQNLQHWEPITGHSTAC